MRFTPLFCALALSFGGFSASLQATPLNTQETETSASMSKADDTDKQPISAHFAQVLEDIWQYELSEFPGMAKSRGLATTRAFTDISPEALAKRHAQFKIFLATLLKIDATALDQEDRISLLMQEYRLRNYIDSYRFNEQLVPITSEYGFHNSYSSLPDRAQLLDQKAIDTYLDQLQSVPAQFEQQIAYMRQGLAQGYVQPKVVLKGFEDSISVSIAEQVKDSPFYQPFSTMPAELQSAENMARAEDASSAVNAAYQAFYDFMVNEYIAQAKDDISVKTWPNGEDFYNNRIKHYTTTDMTAQEIHTLGLSEVARIRGQMQEIVDELAFDGDINAFIAYLRSDPKFYAKTPEELLMTASFIAKKMDAKLPKLFNKLPRTPYGVAPVPESIAPKYTTGRYISPRTDTDPGYYWVNTYALDKRPLYALPALTLHEAVPGHHLQISLAAEMDELPQVRRATYISAFGEGWGLYSEYLGLEVGIYGNPYDNFGRLSYEMWRACRLVVDTGMHMFGWSRDKALNYMLENTALSEHNVRTEIDRYISWPAQALSYKIGEIKIKALREKVQTALGEHFDVRSFHAAVLAHGSVPLFVLEQNIDKFITEQLAAIPQ